MDRFSFMAMCFYYYGCEIFKYTLLTLATLAAAFAVHKLVSWALWVMSL